MYRPDLLFIEKVFIYDVEKYVMIIDKLMHVYNVYWIWLHNYTHPVMDPKGVCVTNLHVHS